jgi:uncharacterized protein YutE (UPF0331/DUF86 family)
MEAEIVLTKLESLNRCITRLEEKLPSEVDILRENYDLQDIIILNLERSVQLCVDLGLHVLSDSSIARPSSMAEVFHALSENGILEKDVAENLAKAVGFRNIAVHEYQELNWDIVWSILTNHISDFKGFGRQMYALLGK